VRGRKAAHAVFGAKHCSANWGQKIVNFSQEPPLIILAEYSFDVASWSQLRFESFSALLHIPLSSYDE
jgi:hypothetical protein